MNLASVQQEINDFEQETIDIAEGLSFNQRDTIKKIIYYYNSQFLSGSTDDQNDKKYFFNINRNPCDVATKAIDFDTKNINILTAKGGTGLKTWFLERDLRFWMKDKNFGRVLNRIFHELPIFGSVVLKIIDGQPYFVDLRNFAVQQDANTLNEAGYIIETHIYTPLVFKKIAEEKGWNNIDEALANKTSITVYERYGEDDNLDYRRTIIAEGDIELSDEVIDHHPYWEFHFDKISGRWLGIGRVELVFDPQIRVNEISNQQSKSSYWSALRLWQSRDTGTKRNLLVDAVNGEILQVDEPITQIDMADRNLSFYQVEINRWLTNKDELTFAHEVTRGERLPAGTPLGSAQLAAGMAGAYFAQIQENIALDIKELLFKVIIRQFAKENTKKHTLRLVGEDLNTYNKLLIEDKVYRGLFDFIKKNKRVPTKTQMDLLAGIITERAKRGKEKLVDIPENFYKDLKYQIDIIITGEQLDTRTDATNRLMLLQALTVDPTILTDPRKRKILAPVFEAAGVNLVDLETEEEPPLTDVIARAGGGISRPATVTAPVRGTVEQRL